MRWRRRGQRMADAPMTRSWLLDMHYVGQNFELGIGVDQAHLDEPALACCRAVFHQRHKVPYELLPSQPSEVVTLSDLSRRHRRPSLTAYARSVYQYHIGTGLASARTRVVPGVGMVHDYRILDGADILVESLVPSTDTSPPRGRHLLSAAGWSRGLRRGSRSASLHRRSFHAAADVPFPTSHGSSQSAPQEVIISGRMRNAHMQPRSSTTCGRNAFPVERAPEVSRWRTPASPSPSLPPVPSPRPGAGFRPPSAHLHRRRGAGVDLPCRVRRVLNLPPRAPACRATSGKGSCYALVERRAQITSASTSTPLPIEIALTKHVSEGLDIVAASVPWQTTTTGALPRGWTAGRFVLLVQPRGPGSLDMRLVSHYKGTVKPSMRSIHSDRRPRARR